MKRLLLLCLFVTPAWGHSNESRDPQYSWCCGVDDCESGSAVPVSFGYFLPRFGEFVAMKDVLPSLDGKYWRCHLPNGERRCFFAPDNRTGA